MTILDEIKEKIEIEKSETIYDNQIILELNTGISSLIKNNIPVSFIEKNDDTSKWENIKENDKPIIVDWLRFNMLPKFDKDLLASPVTLEYINDTKIDILYQLKATYDNGDKNEV